MITRILHFSDTHAEGETLTRIQSLAMNLASVDVVAHTGDAVSYHTHYAPLAWNEWPHRVKLSVSGGHDHPVLYTTLTT
jgi:predicted phosphodiesterase